MDKEILKCIDCNKIAPEGIEYEDVFMCKECWERCTSNRSDPWDYMEEFRKLDLTELGLLIRDDTKAEDRMMIKSALLKVRNFIIRVADHRYSQGWCDRADIVQGGAKCKCNPMYPTPDPRSDLPDGHFKPEPCPFNCIHNQ